MAQLGGCERCDLMRVASLATGFSPCFSRGRMGGGRDERSLFSQAERPVMFQREKMPGDVGMGLKVTTWENHADAFKQRYRKTHSTCSFPLARGYHYPISYPHVVGIIQWYPNMVLIPQTNTTVVGETTTNCLLRRSCRAPGQKAISAEELGDFRGI